MPTLFTIFGMRFFFYSEEHLPIHVENGDGRAKFNLEPEIKLVNNRGKRDKKGTGNRKNTQGGNYRKMERISWRMIQI